MDDSYLLTRLRVSLDFRPTSWFQTFVQGQDSRVGGIDASRVTASFKNLFDLRQAYVDLKAGDKGWLEVRAGRQELVFGSERLIGAGDWGNTSRSFDALRAIVARDGARVDIFAASVVRIYPTRFDRLRPGENLHGIYSSFTKLIPRSTLEPYVLLKTAPLVVGETGHAGDADTYTAGLRWVGQLPSGFDYSLEMARQTGHFADDDISAWAGYWIGGYSPPKIALKPRFSVEYDYATGDAGRGDGKVGAFDQLYPTNHSFYGIVDMVGWRNVRNLRTGVQIRPYEKLRLTLDHHFFWLASGRDGLYNDGGTLIVRAPTGGARHTDVGREVDLFLNYTPLAHVLMGAGFGHLFPGRFLKENSPGGATSYPYVFLTYRF
jgi:hypothetical protein